MKFPTGGDERFIRSQSVTRFSDEESMLMSCSGGSGENPGPTVKVWMGEDEERQRVGISKVIMHYP